MRFVARQVDVRDAIVRQLIATLTDESFDKDDLVGKREPYAHGDWWVVFHGREAVAFAGLLPSYQWHAVGYLCLAGVLPKYRGYRLQRRLIQVRVAEARRKGWTHVLTDTLHSNVASINSLVGCGFRAYKPTAPWASPESIYWRKPLEV